MTLEERETIKRECIDSVTGCKLAKGRVEGAVPPQPNLMLNANLSMAAASVTGAVVNVVGIGLSFCVAETNGIGAGAVLSIWDIGSSLDTFELAPDVLETFVETADALAIENSLVAAKSGESLSENNIGAEVNS